MPEIGIELKYLFIFLWCVVCILVFITIRGIFKEYKMKRNEAIKKVNPIIFKPVYMGEWVNVPLINRIEDCPEVKNKSESGMIICYPRKEENEQRRKLQ